MPPPNDQSWGSAYTGGSTYYEVLTAAIADLCEYGYDSQDRVAFWTNRLHTAAFGSLIPERVMDQQLRAGLRSAYQAKIDRGGILQRHPGIGRLTLDSVKPKLRAELDRRIVASANLIKLNRDRMVEDTLQRFQGWATSVPVGGTDIASRREIKEQVRKPLASLPFLERRVMVDQGHKFAAALSDILATDGGALAGIWHSHWRQAGYNYRRDHKDRDEKLYVVRGNWAMQSGLMKPSGRHYIDEITRPGEEVSCRCFYQWVYNLRSLPPEMLTEKGKEELQRARAAA